MNCSIPARLLFIGMWNFADDHGRMSYSPRTLKAQIFPSDTLGDDAIRRMIDELSTNVLVVVYEADGKSYLQITGWKHQRIDRPQPSKFPMPKLAEKSLFDECSTNAPRAFVECSTTEWSGEGEEGSGDRKKDGAQADAPISGRAKQEKDLFDRGKEVLGPKAGGLIKKLLVAKQNNIAEARAAIEHASMKSSPSEYIGAVLRGVRDQELIASRGSAFGR